MPHPLPDGLREAFAVADARSLGASERRLRGPDLEAPFRGARISIDLQEDAEDAEDADEWKQRRDEHLRLMRAYLPVLAPNGFFCGPSAAVLWRIPLSSQAWPSEHLHVGIHRPRRAPRRPDVRGYQFTRGFVHVTEHEGMPVTDAASTWATLGRVLRDDDLVAATDHVLRVPRHPGGFRPVTETALSTREELAVLTERKGRPGAPALRRALDLARTGAASPPETRIRLILGDAGLPEPVLDFDVYDEWGSFLGCSELAYPELKIAIEYESDGHLTRAQLQRDIDKYQSYAEAGWTVVRLTSAHVYRSPSEAVRRVRQARAAASSRPSIWR